MNRLTEILHGVAVKKYATIAEIASVTGVDADQVRGFAEKATAGGRLQFNGDKYLLTPLAQVALRFDYSRQFDAVRSDSAFRIAYERFETINTDLKSLITRWQTIDTRGARVANDHSDREYDMEIIADLGDINDRVEGLLRTFESALPRFAYYRVNLNAALEKAEAGAPEWVSSARVLSYHTLWFELHEDLLRILDKRRRDD
jgi:hypothetical protein